MSVSSDEGSGGKDKRRGKSAKFVELKGSAENIDIPSVPRPPILIFPNREKGTEKVTTLGVTLRMTMSSAGLDGMSSADMLRDVALLDVNARTDGDATDVDGIIS